MSAQEQDDIGVEAEAEAYAALNEHRADQRSALRDAVTTLLDGGPDALGAAEDAIRDRLSDDGAYALSLLVEALFPEHDGIYWGDGEIG